MFKLKNLTIIPLLYTLQYTFSNDTFIFNYIFLSYTLQDRTIMVLIVGSFTKPRTCTLVNFTGETKNFLDYLLFVHMLGFVNEPALRGYI